MVSLLTAFSLLSSSCEPMDAVDPFGIVHDDDEDDDKSSGETGQQTNPSSSSSQDESSGETVQQTKPSTSSSLDGIWSGKSATGQVSTKLSLNQRGSSVSGSLSWPGGDKRSISGSRSGNSVTLHIGGGDTWRLTVSGNRMSGTGYKAGTSKTYNLSFSR